MLVVNFLIAVPLGLRRGRIISRRLSVKLLLLPVDGVINSHIVLLK